MNENGLIRKKGAPSITRDRREAQADERSAMSVSFGGALLIYWRGMYLCLIKRVTYAQLKADLPSLEPMARLQIYWLALHVRLWKLPHYRSGIFSNDARKNLRNVALPGTGIPLSLLFYFTSVAYAFLWLGVPLTALAAALIARVHCGQSFGRAFAEALLTPRDWFSYWRLNCALAS